ncbi:MAG: hypothetical protein JWO82_3591 [Akkermansiaceae bacterium]|nr:hypothetical protein [Akkermansiaceae bacterium]
MEIKGGPVAFALIGKTGGGLASSEDEKKALPMPKEWKDAAEGSEKPLRLPDDVLDRVWPVEK